MDLKLIIAFLLIILIFCAILFSKKSYGSIVGILSAYFETFKNDRKQIVIYVIFPAIISLCLSSARKIDLYRDTLDISIINNINIVISIFITMLITIFTSLLGDRTPYNNFRNKSSKLKKYLEVKNQTCNMIFLLISSCVLLLIICFAYMISGGFKNFILVYIISFLIYFILLFILINLFIVLKRIQKLYAAKSAIISSDDENSQSTN